MPFQVSPGVNISEIDLTTVVPAVSTTEGAISGVFRWGPIGKPTLVDSEDTLVSRFAKPDNNNAETFFTAANFLAYGNKLYVSRAANTTGFSNTTTVTANGSNVLLGSSISASAGDLVAGNGIVDGTTVSSANATAVVISTPSTLGTALSPVSVGGITFRNPNAVFTAVANSTTLADTDDLGLFVIKNSDDYLLKQTNGFPAGSVLFAAKYPGAIGNSLKVSICDSVNAYGSNNSLFLANGTNVSDSTKISNAGIVFAVGSNQATIFISNTAGSWDPGATTASAQFNLEQIVGSILSTGSILKAGNSILGTQDLRITGFAANAVYSAGNTTYVVNLESNYTLTSGSYSNTLSRNWEYYNTVDKAPSTSVYNKKFGNNAAVDELHIVVADEDGRITGVPGTVLETFKGLSRATDAKTEDGSTLYYRDVINQNSKYIWWINNRSSGYTNTALNISNVANTRPITMSLIGGSDGAGESNVAIGDLTRGYDVYKSAEDIDISLILQGKARGSSNGAQLANYLIDNIAEYRKDCVVFISPESDDVVNNVGKTEVTDVVGFRNSLTSTSYAVLDSGYKYQYDKYNDLYRWVPLNGDIAGLAVRTDSIRDPWWSPAGFNRGQIKNVIKLAYNPPKSDRDVLYKSDVNPVCVFPGQGTVLFGDKTVLGKPSAFESINVRRLFIVLEKAIATAAKFTLFEFNDQFTRAQFKNLVEPFLRDVQGRRGIEDFRVVCDESNNTGEVINRREFVGDIYIKPARAINFIQLNFVAVRSGVEFSEVVGKF